MRDVDDKTRIVRLDEYVEKLRKNVEKSGEDLRDALSRLERVDAKNIAVDAYRALVVGSGKKKSVSGDVREFVRKSESIGNATSNSDDREAATERVVEIVSDQLSSWLTSANAPNRPPRPPKYYLSEKIEAEKSVQRAREVLEESKRTLREYDPSTLEYEFDVEQRPCAPNSSFSVREPILRIEDVRPLVWVSWPSSILDVSYSSSTSEIGPGEERIAVVFGGRVCGGNYSYDVETPDKRVWEVKAVERQTDVVRIAADGIAAYKSARMKLESVVNAVKSFSSVSRELGVASSPVLTDAGRETVESVVSACVNFTQTHYEFVEKGEMSSRRLVKLQKISHMLCGYLTFVREIGDDALKDSIEPLTVKSECFASPREFFDGVFESIRPSEAFRHVDGVFVVNSTLGFQYVPKDEVERAFSFVGASQCRPKFSFTNFDSARTTVEELLKNHALSSRVELDRCP